MVHDRNKPLAPPSGENEVDLEDLSSAPIPKGPAVRARDEQELDFDLDSVLQKINAAVPVVVPMVVGTPTAAGAGPAAKMEKDPLPPGQGPTVGNYQLAGRMRSSPAAMVFMAHRVSQFGIRRPVVVKFAPKNNPAYARNREMLVDEYHAMALLDHPNIAAVYEAAEIDLGFYVALEYIDGPDARVFLDHKVKTKQQVPVEVAAFITIELLRGLEHAHTARGLDDRPLGIVHRDVNPSNILLSKAGQVKLTDFGVVKMRGRTAQETQPGMVKGKPAYLAPEYIRGEHLDHRCDVYSAGIFLFELVLGQKCFRAEGVDIFREVLAGVDLSRLAKANVPDKLAVIIARATDKDPKQRFITASDMGRALETWLQTNRYYVSATSLAAIL